MEILSKAKIKLIRSLRQKKYRNQEGKFVVEGEKLIDEICHRSPELVDFICTTDPKLNKVVSSYLTEESTLNEISALKTGTNMLAVIHKPKIDFKEGEVILALDGIQDPGNLGTIIRTADWFGINNIICSQDTVDSYNEKVVQATMGSIFNVSIQYCDLEAYLKQSELPKYGTLLEGENICSTALAANAIYILGNEGNGIRPEIKSLITNALHIPGRGNAESLNVSIAAAVLMSEITRK